MDFTIGEEERALEETAARVARDLLAPRAAAHDEAARFVGENLAELGKLGFLGLNLREEEGGAGAASLGISLVVERVAGACAATASAMTAHYLATDAIAIAGTDAQKAQWLPAAAEGRALGAFALSEPQAGSNPTDMMTRGEAVEGGWHLTGTKQWITNGGFADFLVVFARTDPAAGARGLSAFLVGRDAPGFRKGAAERTMGLKGAPVFELGFDCRLPADALLGPAGSGFKTAMAVLDRGRVEIASMALGIAGAAFDAARDWAKQRQVGGRPIADLQGLQWMLADMHAELEAARLLTWRAALARDSGQRFSREAAVAKLYASEMAGRVTDAALQIHGGYGYSRALPLERYARDARILRIFEGSSEIQRNIIARELLR